MVINIFRQLLNTVYAWPIILLVLFTAAILAALLLLWLRFCGERNKTFASTVMLILSAFFILVVTVLSREMGSGRELSLLPFISWINYFNGNNEELLRTNIFNMLLFMPFGASFYAVGYTKISPKICLIITVAASLILSVSVESAQFLLRCGEAETDDVIHNALGAVFGVLLARLTCDLYSKRIKTI